MKTIFIASLAILVLASSVYAISSVQYPIAQLGNCSSKESCADYCDVAGNIQACLSYAEENGLMSRNQVANATRMLSYIQNGTTPGGCKTENECNTYCGESSHISECADFALKAGEITKEQADAIKRTNGVGPGGCKSQNECNTYCDDDSHLSECVQFAVDNGMINETQARMVIQTGGKGPGGCSGETACKQYCNSHLSECLDFAVQYGMMSAKEAEVIRNTANDSTRHAYCYANDDNFEACLAIELKSGQSDLQQIAHDRILYYDSPGGCKGDGACLNAYCTTNNEARMDECERWNVKIGQETQAQYEQWKIDFQKMKAESEKNKG